MPCHPPVQTVQVDLLVTLEELYTGAAKSVPRARRAYGEGGEAVAEARRLEVKIEPGMPDGTVFVFEGCERGRARPAERR
jgi:hypothetical protein